MTEPRWLGRERLWSSITNLLGTDVNITPCLHAVSNKSALGRRAAADACMDL